MDNIIINLIQGYGTIALPIGYLCMLIARMGYEHQDPNHKKIFLSFIFSSIIFYGQIFLSEYCSLVTSHLISILLTLSLAYVWRRMLSHHFFNIANKARLTNENGNGTTLNDLIQNTNLYFNGITVETKDGYLYQNCGLGYYYEKTGFTLGIDATGISFPVTHFQRPNETEWIDVTDNLTDSNGTQVTYFPSQEIKRYKFTLKKK